MSEEYRRRCGSKPRSRLTPEEHQKLRVIIDDFEEGDERQDRRRHLYRSAALTSTALAGLAAVIGWILSLPPVRKLLGWWN